jgi:hypothetical protein
MEIVLLPILIPAGLLSLWLRTKRSKSISVIWKENDIHTLSAEGMAFLLGSFSVAIGLVILLIALVMIVLFLIR